MSPSIFYNWLLAILFKISKTPITLNNLFPFSNSISCPHGDIYSLWASDAIWRQRYGSKLAQVMVCCLTTLSHYLNQSLPIINDVLWHSHESNFAISTYKVFFSNMCSEITLSKQLTTTQEPLSWRPIFIGLLWDRSITSKMVQFLLMLLPHAPC